MGKARWRKREKEEIGYNGWSENLGGVRKRKSPGGDKCRTLNERERKDSVR